MKKGFTLIELLIVVAIIAILAAIAVPNFIEAQVRAKVGRALADMRTLRTGMESYCVDHDTYPFSVCPDRMIERQKGVQGGAIPPEQTWTWYHGVTTPVAYLNSIPYDPFCVMDEGSWGGGIGPNPYHYYSGNGKAWSNDNTYRYARRIFFVLISLGPDAIISMEIDQTHADAYMLYVEDETNNGGLSGKSYPYDASNGSKSAGDIYVYSGRDIGALNQRAY